MYTSTDANLQMKCANDSVKKMAGSIFKELFFSCRVGNFDDASKMASEIAPEIFISRGRIMLQLID
jgi:hypothetical protein